MMQLGWLRALLTATNMQATRNGMKEMRDIANDHKRKRVSCAVLFGQWEAREEARERERENPLVGQAATNPL